MKKLLTLLFIFCMLHANAQDWIAYKHNKINIRNNKALDTLHVKIDSIKNKTEQLNHKFFYIDNHCRSKGISIDKVVSYRMNNNIYALKKYTVVYRDGRVVLTNEKTPIYSNVNFVIDNLTGRSTDKNAGNDSTAKIASDSTKDFTNQYSNNDIALISTKLNKLELSVNEINLHLEKHHSEFKYGAIGSVCGIGCTVAGIMLISNGRYGTTRRNNTNNPNGQHRTNASSGVGYTVSGLGVAMSAVGVAIMIDSDKWFSKKHNHIW